MYKVHAKIEGPKTNFPLLGDGFPIPAFIINNFSGGGITMEMLGSYGVTFGYQLLDDTSQLLEISATHIVSIPAGTSVTTLTQ
tara:strand:- start:5411 stop:5659 length:249 start_codon:yes stop_codon:yes gene_type:complete